MRNNLRRLAAIAVLFANPAAAQTVTPLQNQMSQNVQTMMGNLAITNSNLQTQVQYDREQIAALTKQVADLKKQLEARKQALK